MDEISSRVLTRVYEVTEVYGMLVRGKQEPPIWDPGNRRLCGTRFQVPILGGFPPRGAPNESLTPTSSTLQGVQIGNLLSIWKDYCPNENVGLCEDLGSRTA